MTLRAGLVLCTLVACQPSECEWELRPLELHNVPELQDGQCLGLVTTRNGTGFDVGSEEGDCREPADCAMVSSERLNEVTWYVDNTLSGLDGAQPTAVPVDCNRYYTCKELRDLILSTD